MRDESIFGRLRKYRDVRVTFKNLAAMKAFVGMRDDLVILDTHVAKVMGISRNELSRFRSHEPSFKHLLETTNEVPIRLRKEFGDISARLNGRLQYGLGKRK